MYNPRVAPQMLHFNDHLNHHQDQKFDLLHQRNAEFSKMIIIKKLDLKPILPVGMHINLGYKDAIVITRPIKELISHIKHLKLPSIELIARVVKTLFLSIVRWHLCDQVLLEKDSLLLNKEIIHSLSGKAAKVDEVSFQTQHPYMLENAYYLRLKKDHVIIKAGDFSSKVVSPDTLRKYFNQCYQIDITDKMIGNTIHDLFKSKHFDLEYFKANH